MSRSQETAPASGDMLQLFPNIPGNRFLPPVLYKQPNKKAARIIPAACFPNANAQTPAWPLLAGPPPTVDDDIARNVHGRTVSLQSARLQPENSTAKICRISRHQDDTLKVSQRKSGQFAAVRISSQTGINKTEGIGRFHPVPCTPLPHAKIHRCNIAFNMHSISITGRTEFATCDCYLSLCLRLSGIQRNSSKICRAVRQVSSCVGDRFRIHFRGNSNTYAKIKNRAVTKKRPLGTTDEESRCDGQEYFARPSGERAPDQYRTG